MFDVPDRPLICHHQLGKIHLHTRSTADAYLRVNWRETNIPPLQMVKRQYGTSWSAVTSVDVPKNFVEALQLFLSQRRDVGYYYLYEAETKLLLERFRKYDK